MTLAPTVDMLAVAAAFEEAGLTPVPPRADGTKRPYPDRWQAYQERVPMRSELRKWYGAGLTGIGTITGTISGNLELFEFDFYPTYLEFVELAEATGLGDLVRQISEAYSESTPSGGVHWFYRCDVIAGNTKLAQKPDPTPDNPLGRKVLIETRGEGGYAVMAPSYGTTHPTGMPYEVLKGRVEDIPTITPEERMALWQLARSFDRMPEKLSHEPTRPSTSTEGERPGDVFAARTSWQDILGPAGWKSIYRKGKTSYWRRPGKDIGISASTGWTAADTLMVFSTSTPFETAPASYTKFAAYAVLNHGGDYAAAGKALWTQGYKEEQKAVYAPLEWSQRQEPVVDAADAETGEMVPALTSKRVLLDSIIDAGVPPPPFLLEGKLARGFIHLLYGESGHGKTTIALAWAMEVMAMGLPVVFIDEESGRLKIAGLLHDMGARDIDGLFHYFEMPGITKDVAHVLFEYCDRIEPGMILCDSLSDLLSMSGLDDNSAMDVTAWFMKMAEPLVLRPYHPAVTIIDHIAKNASTTSHSAGSRAKRQKTAVSWLVECKEEFNRSKLGRVELTLQKNNPGTMPARHMYVVGGEEGRLICRPFDPKSDEGSVLKESEQRIIAELENAFPHGLQRGQIAFKTQLSKSGVSAALVHLVNRGLVGREGEPPDTLYFAIRQPQSTGLSTQSNWTVPGVSKDLSKNPPFRGGLDSPVPGGDALDEDEDLTV